jgi:5,10-methylenetetrahydromethanopterin reductase
MLRIGVGLRGLSTISEILEYSVLAERLGLDFVWVPDVGLERETFVTATCIALSTKRITIGVITNPYTRHPAISAAAVATLSEAADGRVKYALCVGGFRSLKPFGFSSWAKPLSSIMNAVDLTKRLFQGEEFEIEEGAALRLSFPVKYRIPIYIAVMTGVRMMELAGRIADGVLFAGPLGIDFTKSSIERVVKSAIEAGRKKEDVTIAMEALFSVAYDSVKAKERAKSLVGEMIIADPRFAPAIRARGISEKEVEVVRQSLQEGSESLRKAISEKMVEQFSISGSPQECLEKIRRYAAIGVQEICVLPPLDSNLRETIKIIGEDILPSLRQA